MGDITSTHSISARGLLLTRYMISNDIVFSICRQRRGTSRGPPVRSGTARRRADGIDRHLCAGSNPRRPIDATQRNAHNRSRGRAHRPRRMPKGARSSAAARSMRVIVSATFIRCLPRWRIVASRQGMPIRRFRESPKSQRQRGLVLHRNGVPYGVRTRVTNVKGWCPRPLDERDAEPGTTAPARLHTGPRPMRPAPMGPPAPLNRAASAAFRARRAPRCRTAARVPPRYARRFAGASIADSAPVASRDRVRSASSPRNWGRTRAAADPAPRHGWPV